MTSVTATKFLSCSLHHPSDGILLWIPFVNRRSKVAFKQRNPTKSPIAFAAQRLQALLHEPARSTGKFLFDIMVLSDY